MKNIKLILFFFSFVSCIYCQKPPAKSSFTSGLEKYINNSYEQAFNYFDKAIRLDTTYKEAYYYRGLIYNMYDSLKENAYYDFDKAIKLGLNKAEAYYYRGILRTYIELGLTLNYKLVIADLNKALELDSTLVNAYFYRSEYRIKNAQDSIHKFIPYGQPITIPDSVYLKSINDFSKVIYYKPNSPEVYVRRAILKKEIGDNTGACEDFKKALELGKNMPELFDKSWDYLCE
jgi:tetratricopeptide (TPR) repeat protein